MQVAFHIGANCTDEDRLLKSVLKNAGSLLQYGITVPGPAKYRSLIRDAIAAPTRDLLDLPAAERILAALDLQAGVARLILFNDNFIAVPARICDHGQFYPQAEGKTRALHRLFPEAQLSLFLSIRHPASFLQDVLDRQRIKDLATYLGPLAPQDLRWSDVVRRIRQAAPQTPLTVWCTEDAPLIWDQLIRRISGMPQEMPIVGARDLLAAVLTEQGLAEVAAFDSAYPLAPPAERHGVIADIWAAHARPEALAEEITLPELDAATVTEMTALYHADLDVIAAMPGVRLMLPFR